MDQRDRLPDEALDFLFEEHPFPSWIYDAATLRFLKVNRAAVEEYGYSTEEFLGLTLKDIRPPEDVAGMRENSASRHVRKDHSVAIVRVVSSAIQYEGRPAGLVVVHDLQEQTLAQQALARSERLLRSVWTNAADAMRISDRDGITIRVNEAYCRFAGLGAEELEDRPFWIIYPEKDQASIRARYLERFRTGSFAPVAEHRVTLRNGRKYTLELSNAQLQTDQGTWILTIHRDITERKLSQERLKATLAELERASQRAEAANRAKSAFLANTSHEIRTPMNGILGLADLALQERHEPNRREYLQLLKSSAEGLMDVLNDVLDLSKIEARQMSLEKIPFSVTECVQKAVATLLAPAQSKGLTLSCHIGEVPPAVTGDPVRVRQILLNLIGNAIKFTEHGYVRVSAEPFGESIRFTVEDSGIGIVPEHQITIFEPFQQADISTTRTHGGTGLGLSIVAELVRLMHGRISLESQPSMGATFRVELGLAPAALPVAMAASGQAETRLPPLDILVADDHPTNRLVTSRLLERRGHRVTVVSDGSEALCALERGRFDLVLMDVQMPVMDGLAATAAIRAKEGGCGKRLPIIGLTAHAMRGDEEAFREAGMDAYVPKPVRVELLFERIGEVLAASRCRLSPD